MIIKKKKIRMLEFAKGKSTKVKICIETARIAIPTVTEHTSTEEFK
jgi:hypothetical protein